VRRERHGFAYSAIAKRGEVRYRFPWRVVGFALGRVASVCGPVAFAVFVGYLVFTTRHPALRSATPPVYLNPSGVAIERGGSASINVSQGGTSTFTATQTGHPSAVVVTQIAGSTLYLTGITPGTATIQITGSSGQTATENVTVGEEPPQTTSFVSLIPYHGVPPGTCYAKIPQGASRTDFVRVAHGCEPVP
jgi:hypothetical protein